MTFTPFTPFTPFTNFSDRSRCTKEVPPITLKPSLVLWQEAFRAKGAGSHAAVSEALEQGLANNELVTFSWNWGQLKNGKISNYVADPCNGVVRNLENGREKRLRRVLVADM